MISTRKLISHLKSLPSVKGLAYAGGKSKGYFDKHSDIDLIVLIDGGNPKTFFDKYVHTLDIDVSPHPHLFSELKVIPIRTSSDDLDFKIITVKEYSNIAKTPSGDLFIAYTKDIKIIYDPDGILKTAKYKKVDEKSSKEALKWIIALLRAEQMMEVLIERDDHVHINNAFSQIIVQTVKIVYILNKKPFLSTKWSTRDIAKMKIKPSNFDEELRILTLLGNSPDEVKTKVKIIQKVSNELYALIQKIDPSIDKVKEYAGWRY